MFATYVHHLDPIIFVIGKGLALRWYGLAYLIGFLLGFLLLKNLSQKGLWVIQGEKIADFIAATAFFGVFLGGRLGYVLFYMIPDQGWDRVAQDPWMIFRVWEGGMASHGGLLGLIGFTYFYAKKHQLSWAGLADGLCVVGPLGLMCGRIANFINGELYGRIATNLPWAVKFPTAFDDSKAPESSRWNEAFQAAMDADPNFSARISALWEQPNILGNTYSTELLNASRESQTVREAIAPFLEDRHPSQLYAAFLEGALIFAVLWLIRTKYPKAPKGLLTGLFFGLYATGRIVGEFFREPDSAWVIQNLLTRGQFLSLFLYLFAAGFLIYSLRSQKKAVS